MRPTRLPYLPELDGLRGIAILLVMIFHFPSVAGSRLSHGFTEVAQHSRSGFLGLDIFLVLSGYLITRILLEERAQTGRIAVGSFYLRRALRICPAYYLCLLFCGLMHPRGVVEHLAGVTFLSNFFYAIANTDTPVLHTWSLAIEVQFYLAWPLFVILISQRWARPSTLFFVPAMAATCGLVAVLLLKEDLAGRLVYFATPIRVFSLSLGAYVAYSSQEGRR